MDKIRLRIFAYHVQCLATEPPGSKFGLGPCDGVNVEVTIEKAQTPELAEDRAWDQVTFDGKPVGNRSGAIKTFAELVHAACDGIHPDND